MARIDSAGNDLSYTTEDDVLRSLRRIIRAVDLYSRKLMSAHGLSGPQLLAMRQLTQGGMRSGELARALSLSPATVTGILDRLESRGLVARVRQTDDKRTVLVSLTGSGRRLIRQAPPPLQESFLSKLRSLPDSEQMRIAQTLRSLVSMMAADEIDAAPMLATDDPLAVGSEASAALMDDV